MGVRERLKAYLRYKNITQTYFAVSIGASTGYVNAVSKGFGEEYADRIRRIYPDLSYAWLITGEGEMLKSVSTGVVEVASDSTHTTPLLPLSAQGGTLNDFVLSVKAEDCERIVSPIKGVDFAITVTGDSMAPDYPNGAQVLIKRVDSAAFIEWGRVYVLDTCNGTVIKEVRNADSEEYIMCYSLNPDPKYAPFRVRRSDIYGMYRVLMCMALK